ncbi:tagatose-6-phosphate kinase [Enterococcus sp. AZ194]|uniref:1-phosphofructokinase family hexose kinase n=1 Tax=Enterococcus sp. AZ194 TaxID=2774629 RepID=UPI003F221E82
MILTITLNPSMDYNYFTDELQLGKVNRVENPAVSIGGKGINAGRVAALSGSPLILTGVLGGPNGRAILNILKKENLYDLEFSMIEGNSRNAVTIMHDTDTHTELVEKGLYLSKEEEKRFYSYLLSLFTHYSIDVICISGSVNSDNQNFYSDLVDFIRDKVGHTFPLLLDISGNQLENVLLNRKNKPTFIKPNTHELNELLNEELTTTETLITALQKELFDGIDIVMVSRGSKGALVKYKQAFYEVTIPKVDVVNTTGCGDATVGGMAHALRIGLSVREAIKYAMACGMSNAQFETNGMIDLKTVLQLQEDVHMTEIINAQ